jgi:hypothetical protein
MFDFMGQQGPGLLGNIHDTIADNRAGLMGFGLGLMGGGPNAYQNASEGFSTGNRQDSVQRQLRQKQAEEFAKRQQAAQLAKQLGLPEQLAADPDAVFGIAQKLEMQKRTPRETSLQERLYNSITDPAQKEQARNAMLGIGRGEQTYSQQVDARRQQAIAEGIDLKDPRNKEWVLTGKFAREDAQAQTATDKKELWKSQDALAPIEDTLSQLKTAAELNNKTFDGWGSAALGNLGTSGLPGTGLIDQDKAKATAQYNAIMKEEAIKKMADTLAGATTDSELNHFLSIAGDTSRPPEQRQQAIDRLTKLAQRKYQTAKDRISSIKGEVPTAGGSAQRSIMKHPSGATIERLD